MCIRARLLLGLAGLAFALPMVASSAAFGDDTMAGGQPQYQNPSAPHRHRSHFGRRHCVECQRAYAKAHDGVDIPSPPSIEDGKLMGGRVLAAVDKSYCQTCQGSVVTAGPIMTAGTQAPGYAVVGGSMMASANAPGYAVVGDSVQGFDPAPIGLSRSGHAPSQADPRMAAMGGQRPAAGAYDPAVVATSIPPAQVALSGPGSDRPHIIGHLLGVPKFGRLRREAQDKERQKHAAIAYDEPNTKVTELPASMVYGKGGR